MSATNPLTAPVGPPADAPAGSEEAAEPSPPAARQGKAACGFCGQPWYGAVAYCPYCGQPSTGVPTHAAKEPAPDRQVARTLASVLARRTMPQGAEGQLPAVQAMPSPALQEPGSSASALPAKDRWKPIVAVAATLALFAIVVDQLSVTPGKGTPLPATASQAAPVPVAAPATAVATPSPAPRNGDTASSTQVMSAGPLPPRADRDAPPQAPAPAAPAPAPAPQRSLCSAANAAAGLCTPP